MKLYQAELHITRCKRLRFAPSKFGFAELLLHRNRYLQLQARLANIKRERVGENAFKYK